MRLKKSVDKPRPNRQKTLMKNLTTTLLTATALLSAAKADLTVPNVFSSNMVLQQKQENKVWGWGTPGESVKVTIANQSKETNVSDDGKWQLKLAPMDASSDPKQLIITGTNTLTFDNVLIGEVWICSGQSNMAMSVSRSNDPVLETKAANYPNIRLLSIPQVGTGEPKDNFNGAWTVCSPDTVAEFSAVGYFFGRQLHQTLDIPVGLIDNAWGGSACEAWINRDALAKNERFNALMESWKTIETSYETGEAQAAADKQLENWKQRVAQAKTNGKNPPNRPRQQNQLTGNQRPANIYNGVLHPTIGYGIRGAIWYQGESNSSRAYQYRDLFPFMIQNWRDEWQQGDFPFYWVQLADFRAEVTTPTPSDWAELREAQTMTMDKLPNAGEAVIIDVGESNDIHPTNKQTVGKRLARWALAKDYGHNDITYRSPHYKSLEVKDNTIILTIAHIAHGLDTFDINEPIGFAIAGEDQIFHNAKAQILGKGKSSNQIKVWADAVPAPVAVRYAWANNPICNVRNQDGLPLTPFRTDTWPGITKDKETK
jgi:sialate O-acetylesterase